jgi:hypothetical protein
MRKLIESTLVSLDGVIEAPERWANFDAEATAYSIKQLGNYDAFVMGRVTYEKFYANWGHTTGSPYLDLINAMPKYVASRSLTQTAWNPPRARPIRRDRPAEGPARQGPHQVRHQPPRRHARTGPPDRRVPLLDHARRGRLGAAAVRARGHLRAPPQAHRREKAGERVGDPHLCARLTKVQHPWRRRFIGESPVQPGLGQ